MSEADEGGAAPIRVVTTEMAYGPHAIAHRDGKVLFVRGAAPREEVEVRIREERSSYAFADLAAVIRPSEARRAAPCRYLPECGGCPWQHIAYEAQLSAKETLVREQLRRLAGLDVAVDPIVPSPKEYGYRRRLKLRVDRGAVGFYAGASHRLVPVDHCLLPEPAVDAAIASAAGLVARLRSRVRRIELAATGDTACNIVASAEVEGGWVSADEGECREWMQRNGQFAGLAFNGRRWRHAWGEPRIRLALEDDLELSVRSGTFTQVNPDANRLLIAAVIALVDPQPGRNVLDLYAGAGNFSLPLARRGASVVAVEQHAQAAADGRANARQLHIETCRFIAASAEEALEQLLARGEQFDVALLDPPRSGAAGILGPLMTCAPQHIVYVACDPATLARDLKVLTTRYRVDTVRPFDLFPHTYHVETVVHATLI